MKSPLRLPGLNSYRGRYIFLTTLALIVISVFAYSSWKDITEANQLTQHNISIRQDNANLLNQITNQFQLTRAQVYKYSLIPDSVKQTDIYHSAIVLLELSEHIDISLFDDVDAEILNNFIFQLPIELHQNIVKLITIRSNSELWIPATRVMSEQLSPVNERVITHLNSITQDEDLNTPEAFTILARFLDFKNLWLSTISEFRLLAANRLGVFDQTMEGIMARQNNLSLRIEQLRSQLQQLHQLINDEQYAFIRDVVFPNLKTDIEQWIQLHVKAKTLLLQEFWRQDILILQQLEVLLKQYSRSIIILQQELSRQSELDIQNLNHINRTISFNLILFCLVSLIVVLIGFFIFDRNILRPIARTTHALYLQSRGLTQELDMTPRASETRELIESFNLMSEQIHQRERRLDFMAHHDALTGLPNRLLFNERLEHAIRLTERSNKQVCLMLLDLDRFKLINDTLGHLFGDKLLQQTATRLKDCIRAEDTIARLGGDEFAIILENINTPHEAEQIARKIIQLFIKPFIIDEQEIHISTSIGLSLAPSHSRNETTLTRYADIAMYQSKSLGRNQFTWFSEDQENAQESMINFENQIREGIKNNQFELYFQPLVDVKDSNYMASEALLRWNHPQRGLLYPESFIAILDNSKLLFDLTCWVIKESHRFQIKIKKQFNLIPRISINLPSIVFQQNKYREKISVLLMQYIDHPECFVLEVTEDTLITDMQNSSAMLALLNNRGYKIALDDFGTGQSSLSHLRAFPIDIIKIDREFVRDVRSDLNDANLVKAIISLGHDLGKEIIAEGVENQDQLNFLSDAGCHLIQGHYFSLPLPVSDYTTYLEQQLNSEPA